MITEGTIIGLGTWLLDKIKDKGFDALYSKLNSSNEIDVAFYKAVKNVSKRMHERYPNILGGKMEYFFKTENVFKELVKLLFINSNVNIEAISSHFDTYTLPQNFIYDFVLELKKELLKDNKTAKIIYDKELFILVYGISNDIESIALNSDLAVLEIKEIKSIIEQRIGDKFNFDNFFTLYKNNAINNLSQVNFIGLGVGVDISKKINRKKLGDVFVEPSFTFSENKHLKDFDKYLKFIIDEDAIKYNQLLNFGNRIVILGNPGSGKSVLVKSIICGILANTFTSDVTNFLGFIPFRIELRKYLAYKKQNRGNIVKYLNSLLEEEYSVNNVTEILLEDILLKKNSIFFFDGLDEIFKVEDKIQIKNDIENFHNSFPIAKSITTSRIIGYEEAKLNEETFCELQINNFNESQIQEYLNKWYEKEEDLLERRMFEVNGFLAKKHEIDEELVSNPLLLSLIVIIYRNTLALPESKLEIYQSCTKTLVEKWDASKIDLEINLETSIYKKRENILADLAYWQYQQLSGDEIEITFEKALNNVAFSIEKLKICDDSDSYTFAENFMSYAQKRSIYFDNNFTHKTFLEYYAAYWIYSNIEKKNKTAERNLLISRYVENPFWHIVLELLLNMIDKNQADSEIMDELIMYQIKTDKKSLPFILTTIKSYKNVSNECLENVIDYTLDLLIEKYNQKYFVEDSTLTKIFDTFKNVYNDKEIRNIVNSKLLIKEKQPLLREYVYALYFEIAIIDSQITQLNFNFELSNKDEFERYLANNKFFFISSCYNVHNIEKKENYLDVTKKFISHFGIEEAYRSVPFYYEINAYLPFIYFYFRTQVLEENIDDFPKNLKDLQLDVYQVAVFFKENDLYFPVKVHKLMFDLFDKENENSISAIICLVLFSSRLSLIKIKEEVKGRRKAALLLEMASLPKDQRIRKILEAHNF